MEFTLPIEIEECHKLIKEMFKRLEKLERENADLKELLNKNSNNSSQPPSIDKKKNNTTRKPSINPSGGQKGHNGHYRELIDEKEADKIVYCELPKNCSCGGEIVLKKDCLRHQVHELPEIKLEVTEYKLARGKCSCCNKNHIASLPEGITFGITGHRLTSLMSTLVSQYQLSRRDLKNFLKEYLNFDLSLGTIFNKEKIVTKALETVVANILINIKKSPFIHSDETGHKRDGKKEWMWHISSRKLAYFIILLSRGKKAMKSLIGDYKDTVISDRYSVYNHFCSENRQFCWAHLKRDFVRLSEKKDKIIMDIGRQLLKETDKLFAKWHEFKAGHFAREWLILGCSQIRKKIGELLEQASYTAPELKAARFAKNLLDRFNALWTFLYKEGVEPTNNQAERCLRKSVIWRKKYFGTRSETGDLFVSRTASVITSCKLQFRNSSKYFADIVKNYFSKKDPPLLSEV